MPPALNAPSFNSNAASATNRPANRLRNTQLNTFSIHISGASAMPQLVPYGSVESIIPLHIQAPRRSTRVAQVRYQSRVESQAPVQAQVNGKTRRRPTLQKTVLHPLAPSSSAVPVPQRTPSAPKAQKSDMTNSRSGAHNGYHAPLNASSLNVNATHTGSTYTTAERPHDLITYPHDAVNALAPATLAAVNADGRWDWDAITCNGGYNLDTCYMVAIGVKDPARYSVNRDMDMYVHGGGGV